MSRPSGKTEAFSRVVIDAQLEDIGWDLKDGQSVRYEYPLPDGTRADYVLCDRHGRAMAVIEAKHHRQYSAGHPASDTLNMFLTESTNKCLPKTKSVPKTRESLRS